MSLFEDDAPLDLVIVGAGFSGLAMAIQAGKAGFERLLILEKGPDVGGTWRDNTYPGAASDVPSHLYALSFAPRSDWSRLYPRQPEIQAYLQALVEEHALGSFLRLDTRVIRAAWDEAAGLWSIETDRGSVRARSFVSAMGALHHPALPDLPGLKSFAGTTFHSAGWDHSRDLTDQRVGVIGTGASAVQFVPEIVSRVARLTLFQRSAPWVLPKGDRVTSERQKRLFARVPIARHLYRQIQFWRHELPALLGFTKVSKVTQAGEALGHRHLRRSVADAGLREKLTPRYRLGCKRVLISDDYFPALTRQNAAVVTEPIRAVQPDGILTADGVEHPLDVLIFATGFDVGGSFERIEIVGCGGVSLSQAWRGGADAFQGISVSGFPNFFLLLGPNTGLGHNSVLLMIEAQVAHVLDGLCYLRRNPGAVLDVTRAAQTRFRAELDTRMTNSIWTSSGCGSWYLDTSGRNRTLWPSSVLSYRHGARRLRLLDYNTSR